MTRSSPITAAEAPLRSRLDASPFYVEAPDIPEGMTCATWRRRRRPRPKPGLLACAGQLALHGVRSLGFTSKANRAIDSGRV